VKNSKTCFSLRFIVLWIYCSSNGLTAATNEENSAFNIEEFLNQYHAAYFSVEVSNTDLMDFFIEEIRTEFELYQKNLFFFDSWRNLDLAKYRLPIFRSRFFGLAVENGLQAPIAISAERKIEQIECMNLFKNSTECFLLKGKDKENVDRYITIGFTNDNTANRYRINAFLDSHYKNGKLTSELEWGPHLSDSEK